MLVFTGHAFVGRRPPVIFSLKGVKSDNTGGEAMAPRPAEGAGSVLHAFMTRYSAAYLRFFYVFLSMLEN